MMSIGEFAREVALSVSAVRFYADRGLLPPAHTDASTGYRFYTDDQIPTGALIRDLRLLDMSLADIADAVEMTPAAREQAVRDHLARLERRLGEIRSTAKTLRTSATGDGSTMLGSTDFAQAIRQVTVAAGTNPVEPHHMCMLIEVKDGSLRCVATDRHRLSVRDLIPTRTGRSFAAVVAAAEIRSWSEALTVSNEIEIELVDGALTAESPEINLSCTALPISFPDYEAILNTPERPGTTAVVDRMSVLSLLTSFGGEGSVVLTATGRQLTSAQGDTVRTTAAEVFGVDGSVRIDPVLAAEVVEQAVGAELVIEFDGPLDPLTFRSADNGTHTSKLMPIKPLGDRAG